MSSASLQRLTAKQSQVRLAHACPSSAGSSSPGTQVSVQACSDPSQRPAIGMTRSFRRQVATQEGEASQPVVERPPTSRSAISFCLLLRSKRFPACVSIQPGQHCSQEGRLRAPHPDGVARYSVPEDAGRQEAVRVDSPAETGCRRKQQGRFPRGGGLGQGAGWGCLSHL